MPDRVAMGCDRTRALSAVGFCGSGASKRYPVSSVLPAEMSDRRRMHAQDRPAGDCDLGAEGAGHACREAGSRRGRHERYAADWRGPCMMVQRFEPVEKEGWRLFTTQSPEFSSATVDELTKCALRVAGGEAGALLRRSRHGTTFRIRLKIEPGGDLDAFIKVIDAP